MLSTTTRTLLVGVLASVSTSAAWSEAQETKPGTSAVEVDDSSSTAERGATSDSSSKEMCIEAHRQSQQAQQLERLVEARSLAVTCSSLSCPPLLVGDCSQWIKELDERIPSVVFEVRLDGNPSIAAQVWADDQRIAQWTRGEAHRFDPGMHTFRFILPPHQDVVKPILLSEGQRFRTVLAEFKSQAAVTPDTTPRLATAPKPVTPPGRTAPAPKAPPLTHRPVPIATYALLSIGTAGLAGFAGFAISGQMRQADLEKTCVPRCSDEELAPMRKRYLIGDVSLGIGAAALLGAGIIYLAAPEQPIEKPTVDVSVLPGGGALTLTVQRF